MAKWKVLALIAIISVAVSCDDIARGLKLQKFVRNNLQETRSLSEKFLEVEAVADKFDNSDFRLPNNTRPTHYNLHVATNIHSANFTFSGTVRINITVLESSNSITLHSRSQTIQTVQLLNADGSNFATAITHELDIEREFLIITVEPALQQGQQLTLVINYVAELEEFQNRGFIRLSHVDQATNATTWLASTHFHPINSRHGYPCYDEVRFRASYELSISHHLDFEAISNTPVRLIEIDGDSANTHFEPTPVIPSYVIGWTVSRFTSVNRTDGAIQFRVFGRPEAVAAGQLDNALEVGVDMLRAMEDLFNISYPLALSTQFAAPQLGGDGAHNWGLISFREHILLQLNDDPVAQDWREIRLGHEYSHIFFGNLVSPEWWTFVWLNEGLATFYENVLNDILFPEKNQWERFLIEFFDVSIENDIYDFVEPLNRYVETQQEIRSRFNFITYQKAALVLRMFQQGLTDRVWTGGLANYLVSRSLDSASPEDLFVGLRESVDEVFPSNTLPDIGLLMNTWLNFAGFPVVTVSRNGSNLHVTQEGFRTSHQEIFGIPLTFTTASNPNFEETIADFWMTTRELTITQGVGTNKNWTGDDWIIFNLRDTAYYVTNYDEPLWQLIINALNNDHEAIHFLNRGTLYADLHRFIAENYDIRASLFLDMMQSLPLETHSHVWVRANGGLRKFEERLRGSRLHRMHMNFVREMLTPVYGREFDDIRATNIVNRGSCLAGVEQCRTEALNALVEEFETGSTNFVGDYRCNGFLTANETVWRHFFNLALARSDSNRIFDFADLHCTHDREILRFYFEQAIDSSNNLQPLERELIFHTAASISEASYEALIEFIEENHSAVQEITSLENLLLSLSVVTNTECQAERVLYLTRFLPVGSNPGRTFFRTAMIANLNFLDANFEQFHDWYDNFEASRSV